MAGTHASKGVWLKIEVCISREQKEQLHEKASNCCMGCTLGYVYALPSGNCYRVQTRRKHSFSSMILSDCKIVIFQGNLFKFPEGNVLMGQDLIRLGRFGQSKNGEVTGTDWILCPKIPGGHVKHLPKGHESRRSSTSRHERAGPRSKWPTSDAAPAVVWGGPWNLRECALEFSRNWKDLIRILDV